MLCVIRRVKRVSQKNSRKFFVTPSVASRIFEERSRRCTVCTERGSAAVPRAPATPVSKTPSRRPTRWCESATRASISSSRTKACSRPTADIWKPCWRMRQQRRRRRRRRRWQIHPMILLARPSLSQRQTDNRHDRSPPCWSRPSVNMSRSTQRLLATAIFSGGVFKIIFYSIKIQ